MYQDINIYDNTINYLNIGFVSPVSTDGFGVFDYNIRIRLKLIPLNLTKSGLLLKIQMH
jgi:hypothetical protein